MLWQHNRSIGDAAVDEATRLSAKTTVHRAEFPLAVRRAGFELLCRGDSFIPGKHDLVVGAAPWSDRDLEILDQLVLVVRGRNVRVTVFDIDELDADMVRVLPGMRLFIHTPVVLQYRNGELVYFGEGRDADLWLQQFLSCSRRLLTAPLQSRLSNYVVTKRGVVMRRTRRLFLLPVARLRRRAGRFR